MSRPPSTTTLTVLLNGQAMGQVTRAKGGRLGFDYAEAWLTQGPGTPLSLSMPLTSARHGHKPIAAFMWGLLPDNELILQRWGQEHKVSPKDPFALLAAVGEDCPGALQFATPDRLAKIVESGDVQWIDEADIASRISQLRQDAGSAGRMASDTGQFSLAGAQPKTAYYRKGNKWGIPNGRIPTTHILKPPLPDFDGHTENEHFCLQLANKVGLPSAKSEIVRFASETAIVIERYDRRWVGERLVRVHQEDMCQALAVDPASKYQAQGGPGIPAIMNQVLSASSQPSADRRNFMRAVAFNFIIGGTDAHAKNYSVLLGPQGSVRFAPLYDTASILPYEPDIRRLKFPMKIGTHYNLDEIRPRHWEHTARLSNYPAEQAVEHVRSLIEVLPDSALSVLGVCRDEGLKHPVLDKLIDAIAKRAATLKSIYGSNEVLN